MSPVPIKRPITSELSGTTVFNNSAPGPVLYRGSVSILTVGCWVSVCRFLIDLYNVFSDRKVTEERSSSKKEKHSDGNAAAIKASSEPEPMEKKAAAPAPPQINGQQELLHSEGDTQSN